MKKLEWVWVIKDATNKHTSYYTGENGIHLWSNMRKLAMKFFDEEHGIRYVDNLILEFNDNDINIHETNSLLSKEFEFIKIFSIVDKIK